MDITPRRRRAMSTALALLLAIESVSVVAAAAQTHAALREAASPPVATTLAAIPAPRPAGAVLDMSSATEGAGIPDFGLAEPAPTAAPAASPAAGGSPTAAPDHPRDAKPTAPTVKRTTPPAKASTPSSPTTFSGRNHVWIPSLGINRSVASFPCDRKRPPDNHVYRWGCAGTNNVYLLGHAYSVFKPLHDAYVNHRLRVGMKAYYADGKGKVHVYAVKWWKLTLPTTAASWAWAPQSAPSMTLQTCVGKNNKYRLMVRLVEVSG